ncbi:hypothetical protein P691DRAFT_451507 [Macrolepiota fuliginosa MF-IS2]|uniref:Uncharacterized protein n=1 Tax=Macrolepiota fuliginosa MF-IS2 TaxID=1400762 RepID=A0A9P5XFX0_9AGAR|nr:hypothetical protein P691DRAFT_451507 [Macrolepiota fuliginosa MF-IS2]
MGKWTPNYTDNILNTKLSALITGAINRAAVEKEPTITYEEFVNELDTGDAFTTSLVDILVKELAERHTHPFQNNERRLITHRTAERLFSLANSRQIYRGERPGTRNHAGRRTYNLAEFMNLPTNEMDMEDEENDFGNLLDATTGAAEGARFNTDLFEAYGSHAWSPISRRLGTTPSPPLEDEPPVWRPLGALSTTGRNSTWAAVPTSSSTSSTALARHPSIRRPTRSRMVDFHDWTMRRRSSIRDSIGAQAEASDSNSSLSLGNSGESSQTVRRFFPTITRRLERRAESREDRYGSDSPRVFPLGDWPPESGPTQASSSSSDPHFPTGTGGIEADNRPLPRLRRGSVRPPEMLWSHRYSWSAPNAASRPTESTTTNTTDSTAEPPSLALDDHTRSVSPGRENEAGSASAEPVGYPTPNSIDNEPTSL